MAKAEKRELKQLSLAYIYYQPLPTALRQDMLTLNQAIEGFKKNLIIECLEQLVLLRGVEHTIIRKMDVHDWDSAVSTVENMMMLVLFGWAYPNDNKELRDGG